MTLLQQHQDYLAARGISEQDALGAGYQSISDPRKLIEVGYKPTQAAHVPGLLIPLFGPHGDLVGHQYRADNPRTIGKRIIKFDNPHGQSNRVTFPGTAVHAVHIKSKPLVVVEGPVKALSIWANLEWPAATLTGVWNWVGKTQGAEVATVLADWRELDLGGREVLIAFDADVRSNAMVHGAAQQLAGLLRNRKAEVRFIVLPEEEIA